MAKRLRPIEEEVAQWDALRAYRPKNVPKPGPGEESVWDYPRPPKLEAVDEAVRIEHRGQVLVETQEAVRVCETASPPTFYVPWKAVQEDCFTLSPGSSYCEWKGVAKYWDLNLNGQVLTRVGWSYEDPFEPYESLVGYVGLYPGPFDACYVGASRASPQPGQFYAGWVLPNILGPFKGAPGSEAW